MRGLVIAIAIAGAASPAYADYADEAGPLPAAGVRSEVGVSPTAGFVQAQQAHGMLGARIHGGTEFGRAGVFAEAELYDLQSTPSSPGPPAPGSGAGHEVRIGFDARYDVIQARMLHRPRGGRGRYERLDIYVDGGVGRETIQVGDDPSRSRADIAVGGGLMMTNRGGSPSFGLRVRFELAPPFADAASDAAPAVASRTSPGLDQTFQVGFVVAFGN